MQYLYSQEEHDAVRTDRAAFDKAVADHTEVQLKLARARVTKVIEEFFKATIGSEHAARYGAQVSYQMLKIFAQQLHKANHSEESCDKDTGTVIQ